MMRAPTNQTNRTGKPGITLISILAILFLLSISMEGPFSGQFIVPEASAFYLADQVEDQTLQDVISRYGLLWENADAHNAEVWRVRWSPDSTKVVSASFDNTAAVFDAQTGKMLMKLEGHTDNVRLAEYSPDGTRIATGSDDKTIKIWDAGSGELQESWEGHDGGILFFNWSYDGSKLVSASGYDIGGIDEGKGSEIIVWDTAVGEVLFRNRYHQDDIMEVSFSPDGSMIASSSDDREIGIWDAETGDMIKALTGSLSGVLSVQWSPDGSLISTGSRYHWLRIWDTDTWQEVAAYSEPTSHCIRTTSWSSDMTVVLSTGTGNEIIIWDPTDGTVLRQLPGPVTTRCAGDYIVSVKFSPDNKYFAFGTSMAHSVRVYGLGGIGNSDPEPNAEKVMLNPTISITSNIPLDGTSINENTLEVYSEYGELVEGIISYHDTSFTIMFVPSEQLEYNTVYHVRLSGNVEDSSDKPLGLPYTFAFRTELSPETGKAHESEPIGRDVYFKIGLGVIIIILVLVLFQVYQRRARRFEW